jgi:hypothetical protein
MGTSLTILRAITWYHRVARDLLVLLAIALTLCCQIRSAYAQQYPTCQGEKDGWNVGLDLLKTVPYCGGTVDYYTVSPCAVGGNAENLWFYTVWFVGRPCKRKTASRGCSEAQRKNIDAAISTSKKWLVTVEERLSRPNDDDAWRKVKNLFGVDVRNPADANHREVVRNNFDRVLQNFDLGLSFVCSKTRSITVAFVKGSDPTITLAPEFFEGANEPAILIHERAHTILEIHHQGTGAGYINGAAAPGDSSGLTFDQAISNSYSYSNLATALQTGGRP